MMQMTDQILMGTQQNLHQMSDKKLTPLQHLINQTQKAQKNKPKNLLNVESINGGTQELRKSARDQLRSQYQNQQYKGINQVLVYHPKKKGQKRTYYIPTYIRMRINRVNQINYIQSKSQIQTDIRIWLMIKQFPQKVQQQIINQAIIQINSSLKIKFSDIIEPDRLDSSFMRNKSKTARGFLLTQTIQLQIQSNAFWSPFELIKLLANLQIKKITLGQGNKEFLDTLQQQDKHFYQSDVQFNFIDAHPFLQFSFGEVRHLGSFDIAESLVDMKWTNDVIKDEDQQQLKEEGQEQAALDLIRGVMGLGGLKSKQQKIRDGQITPDAYQHGLILIPLYKYPSTTIINIFLPLYMVGIMNLGVFFQLNDMSNRDASLATFLLAYIAFFPTIRENLPETPKLVLTEILVYIQIVCSLLCFFYSLNVNKVQQYTFVWYQTPIFLICISLTIGNIIIVMGLFIIHKAVWERGYNKLPKGSNKYINSKSLNTDDTDEWWNKQCEQQFRPYIQNGMVIPLVYKKKRKSKSSNPFINSFSNIDNQLNGTQTKFLDNSKVIPIPD